MGLDVHEFYGGLAFAPAFFGLDALFDVDDVPTRERVPLIEGGEVGGEEGFDDIFGGGYIGMFTDGAGGINEIKTLGHSGIKLREQFIEWDILGESDIHAFGAAVGTEGESEGKHEVHMGVKALSVPYWDFSAFDSALHSAHKVEVRDIAGATLLSESKAAVPTFDDKVLIFWHSQREHPQKGNSEFGMRNAELKVSADADDHADAVRRAKHAPPKP